MPLAAIPAVVWGGIAGAGGAVGAAALQQHGQTEAAKTQADASKSAAEAQLEAAQEALTFQKQKYNQTQQALNPYQNMGLGALTALGTGLGVTPGNLPVATIPLGSGGTPIQNQTHSLTGATSGFLTPQDYQATLAVVSPADQAKLAALQSGGSGLASLSSSGVRS